MSFSPREGEPWEGFDQGGSLTSLRHPLAHLYNWMVPSTRGCRPWGASLPQAVALGFHGPLRTAHPSSAESCSCSFPAAAAAASRILILDHGGMLGRTPGSPLLPLRNCAVYTHTPLHWPVQPLSVSLSVCNGNSAPWGPHLGSRTMEAINMSISEMGKWRPLGPALESPEQ